MQLLAINNSLSQTHTDIGLLLAERRESEGDKEIVTEVRALLDKNDAAMNMVEIELDEGLKNIVNLYTPMLVTIYDLLMNSKTKHCFITAA